MITALTNRGRTILAGLFVAVFAALIGSLIPAKPVDAASTVSLEWVNATTVRFGGSAVKTPVEVAGDLVGGVVGTPAGSQTFMAVSNGPIEMSFGCKVSMTLDIFPDASGKLDFSKGEIIFTTSSPSTCSQDTLRANINGLVHDPSTGTANISLKNVSISGLQNRGPAGGDDTKDKQIVNVIAGMGPASDNTGLPQNDVLLLCEVKGAYESNIDALIRDCLARKSGVLSADPLTSNNLETIKDGKGPNGGDEKGWTGQFKNVKAGIYVACSANFKACQLFSKNPGQIANVYVIFGSTPGSVIPGTPPGQGQAEEKVCTTGPGLSGNLAWVLCPVVQLIAGATDFFENNIIVPFMTVSPLTTNDKNPTYILWQNIRNVANVAFIIFFFVVIFSQATSIGISNYGIKRILPKMAIVVIGVNLSYFIVAFIIDAFNIFGAGISQLVTSALQQAGTTQLNSGSSAGKVQSIFVLGGAALLTIVASGGAAIGWLFSFLLLVGLIVAVVVIVLVVRQMAIITLVIIAPVAILMYMLPNTENYFNKWRKLLIQLLMMYPMIVLLFAAGKIFGIILQQPDFKLAGEGVSDDVAQAVRVILQFVVYVVPLVFLPATFAASGALMGRAYGWLSSKAIQPGSQRLRQTMGQDAAQRLGEAKMRMARMPGIGKVAGYGMRRNYVRDARKRNLEREQQEYTARAIGSSGFLRAQAAGVAGKAGQTRAAAYAAQVASKARSEDIDNEMALLDAEMRRLGTNRKAFASATARYYEDKDKNAVFEGSNGQTFNFKDNESRLQRALLNSAADQGEVSAIEVARMSTSDEGYQTMLDDIIRRNDSTLKQKGGYHLATQFNLAAGRMQPILRNEAGQMLRPDGSVAEKVEQAARINNPTPVQMQTEMLSQRLNTIAQSGANSVAGMKAGLLANTADTIERAYHPEAIPNDATPEERQRIIAANEVASSALNSLSKKERDTIFNRLHEIVTTPNTLARSEGGDALKKMYSEMQRQGYTYTGRPSQNRP